MDHNVTSDPILDEIHAARQAISEKFGGDLKAIIEDARKRQEASGRPIWRPKAAAAPIAIDPSVPAPSAAAK